VRACVYVVCACVRVCVWCVVCGVTDTCCTPGSAIPASKVTIGSKMFVIAADGAITETFVTVVQSGAVHARFELELGSCQCSLCAVYCCVGYLCAQ
jgi:hypothetical protein